MPGQDLWSLIELTRRESGGDLLRQAEVLRTRLRQVSGDELADLWGQWEAVKERLYSWPVWDASWVLLDWVSDDVFGDVRAWIISHGRETFDRVIENPDNLADLADDVEMVSNGAAETINLLWWIVWHERFEEDPDLGPTGPPRPTGTRAELNDFAAVRALFPRLAAIVENRQGIGDEF